MFSASRSRLLSSCGFFLFERSFIFFPHWRVETNIEIKTGPVVYRGPFLFARRPAHWVPFAETALLATALDTALSAEHEILPFAEYQRLVQTGNPVVLELKLRSWKELGRTAFCFHLEDYGNWLRLSRWPWKSGAFQGWACWERVVGVTPSREKALERVALAVQRQFPPRGFDFKPHVGLVRELRRAPWPRQSRRNGKTRSAGKRREQ